MFTISNSAAAKTAEVVSEAVISAAYAEGLLSNDEVVGYRVWYAVYIATSCWGLRLAASHWAPVYSACWRWAAYASRCGSAGSCAPLTRTS